MHWPKDPNMPGMLQIEALVQMAALTILTMPDNKGKVVYLVSADNLKFKKKIIPGDRLKLRQSLFHGKEEWEIALEKVLLMEKLHVQLTLA